jgi:hypothetical protein
MVIVPFGAMLTHGVSACPADSLAISAASILPPNVIAKERPAAPIMIWRRETSIGNFRS